MSTADPSEFHWASKTICEFRGKWYWTDETEDFGNYRPWDTQAEAEKEQSEYAKYCL
jgi:hypothetical protein